MKKTRAKGVLKNLIACLALVFAVLSKAKDNDKQAGVEPRSAQTGTGTGLYSN